MITKFRLNYGIFYYLSLVDCIERIHLSVSMTRHDKISNENAFIHTLSKMSTLRLQLSTSSRFQCKVYTILSDFCVHSLRIQLEQIKTDIILPTGLD